MYVNGKNVGGHTGGYIGFTLDVTDVITKGSNEILVRADNTYNPEVIPSQKSDFFIFGGITRDVWLETRPVQHVSNLKITTPNVSNDSADLKAHAGVGAAMSNAQHRADMELIKDMGTNFVRLAHYPQDPEIYKACDELGLLVWDELPWCRGGLGNDAWKANTKTMLKEIIEQNYNHPSIILWSLGNEIYWLPDFESN